MKELTLISAIAALAALSTTASANLKVVTTTSDLASIASAIGGSHVSASSLINGARDPHRLEAKPSYMSRAASADVFIAVGLELEIGYEPPILDGSGNRRIAVGSAGHIYASDFAYVLEKPSGGVTRADGDIHPYGNPHVWLDPYNGRLIAAGIAARFEKLDKANTADYQSNLKNFQNRLDSAMFGSALVSKFGGPKLWQWHNAGDLRSEIAKAGAAKDLGGWLEKMLPLAGTPIVTYHRSLSYLANRFKFKVVEELEPKPGLEPTPGHLSSVIKSASSDGVKAIVQESFYATKHAQLVATRIGAKVIVIPQNVGQMPGTGDYISLFDVIVSKLSEIKG
ncbi:MAG: metal ABC transporter substrate-binding protein [Fimbriimonadaceae bacterium]